LARLVKQPFRECFWLTECAQVPAGDLFSDETQAFFRDAVLEVIGKKRSSRAASTVVGASGHPDKWYTHEKSESAGS
jgi:hypothetical protein